MERNVKAAMDQMTQNKASGATIHVPYIQLGPKPSGHAVDTSHLHRCTSCNHTAVHHHSHGILERAARGDNDGGDVLQIGAAKQLFIDNHLVSDSADVKRIYPKGRKEKNGLPIMIPDRPWEDASFGFYGSVIFNKEAQKYRMWYHAWWRGVAYAESHDGVNWVKPEVGVLDLDEILLTAQGRIDSEKAKAVEFRVRPEWMEASLPSRWRGKKNNLISLDGSISSHAFTVLYLDGKYLATYDCRDPQDKKKKQQVCMATSDDGGFTFTTMNEGRPLAGRAADTYTTLVWDGAKKRHLMLGRHDFGTPGGWREIRGHRVLEKKEGSKTWEHLTKWYLDTEGKAERDRRQLYALTATPHGGLYIGLLSAIHYPRDISEGQISPDGRAFNRDVVRVHLATSRDAITWDTSALYQEDAGYLVPPGEHGTWDKGHMLPAAHVVTAHGRHWIYYMAMNERHEVQFVYGVAGPRLDLVNGEAPIDVPEWKGRIQNVRKSIGVVSYQVDRLSGLEAGSSTGHITTRALVLSDTILSVDALLFSGGALKVAILDMNMQVIDGFDTSNFIPIKGPQDGDQIPCQWQTTHRDVLQTMLGRHVHLRFDLTKAQLFGFGITNNVT